MNNFRSSKKFHNILNWKKESPTQVFCCEYYEIFKNNFLRELLRWLLLHFFLKVIKQLFRNGVNVSKLLKKFPCYDVVITFSSQHVLERRIVSCKKSRSRLFTNLSSISNFNFLITRAILFKTPNTIFRYLSMCL